MTFSLGLLLSLHTHNSLNLAHIFISIFIGFVYTYLFFPTLNNQENIQTQRSKRTTLYIPGIYVYDHII